MARLEAGDPRWIVQEREDGRNCNNWHWTTKDVSANTKAELIATLTTCAFPAPLALAKIKSAEVTGDASVNNRKGKIFLIYDFEVRARTRQATGSFRPCAATPSGWRAAPHWPTTRPAASHRSRSSGRRATG